MNLDYSTIVDPALKNAIKIILDEKQIEDLDDFVGRVIIKKRSESHHQIDGNREALRWETGVGGELAMEKLLGKSFVDFSVGDSVKYHKPDLGKIGINAGIKTVEYGKFPIIFKQSYKPEAIIIKKTKLEYYICGLAEVEVLNKFQSDDLILSPQLRRRGTKTGFYGFNGLIIFNNFEELERLC